MRMLPVELWQNLAPEELVVLVGGNCLTLIEAVQELLIASTYQTRRHHLGGMICAR